MVAIKKTSSIINDSNLTSVDNTHVYITRKADARDAIVHWDHKYEIPYESYDIKESDFRTKTATITTPQYIDLTTGQYCILIVSNQHETFSGVFLETEYEYNSDTGLYTYQLQDHSRNYQAKFESIIKNTKLHPLLKHLITRGAYPTKGKVSNAVKKEHKKALSGLRPAHQYEQRYYGATYKSNPMTTPVTAIIRNMSWIEAIKNLVLGTGAYIDVYFDMYGVIHIEPYHKDDLFNSGLYLTTPEIAQANYKFDTTNIQTGVIVLSNDSSKSATAYGASKMINLNLASFFGNLSSMINNPNTSTTTTSTGKSTAKNTKKSKTTKNKSNPYGTKKKRIYLNTDSITSYTVDMKRMKDMKTLLEKQGWKVVITGVGAEAHWKRRGEVKNGIWFCLYGGACAGTLKEHCTSSWFLNPLKKNKSRVVVGFFPPASSIKKGGKYYKHLGPAHDWQGNRAYANIDYPAKFLSKHGIPFMYANNAKEMVNKFLAGGDNYTTSGANYKAHDSWQKHKLKWL